MQQRLFIALLTVFCSEIANFAKPENFSGQVRTMTKNQDE
jgi:hypothetical protein